MTGIEKGTYDDELLFDASFRLVEPEIADLPVQRVKRVNLDVPSAVVMVLGIAPRLLIYREDIVQEFRSFDVTRFDRLEHYTMALSHTHALYVTAGIPPEVPRHLYDKGYKLRDTLHTDATVLIGRGLINPAALRGYRGLVGYENVAGELQLICQVLKVNWSEIHDKCATSLSELEHALRIAGRLLRITKQRKKLPEFIARAADQRNRCFTLFIDTYSEARWAVQYLRRHEGDADGIAPPLYSGRAKAKKHTKQEPTSEPAAIGAQASAAGTGMDDLQSGPYMK